MNCINCRKKKINKTDWWCTTKCKEKFFIEYYSNSLIRIKHDLVESNNPENQKLLDRIKEIGIAEAILEIDAESRNE